MKKTLQFILPVLLFFSLKASAQSQNSLYFDNTNDFATVPNASSLIANSPELSLSFWVYPENTTATSADYDGFAGIRNNADADFYILQLSPTDVEARFRNSAGINFDIVAPVLILNAWQHFVLTYDGTTLSLYHNGILASSMPANGVISNAAQSLEIGNLIYFTTNFYTNGKIDEVSLWSKALTLPEITCIYTGVINPTETDLQLYYKFNQGVAGGNNITVNTLVDAAGNINGTLNGFALTGSTSNWVAGVVSANSATISDTICPGTTYTFGSQTITSPGTYFEAFATTSGCDSVVELILTAPVINTVVGQVGVTLNSQQAGAGYQWIDCLNGNAAIPGATNQTYVATANGQYAVVVTLGGCSDTSVCVNVINVGINDVQSGSISVSPNPFSESLTISNISNFPELNISVFDALGKKVLSTVLKEKSNTISNLSDMRTGTYWVIVHETGQRLMVVKK